MNPILSSLCIASLAVYGLHAADDIAENTTWQDVVATAREVPIDIYTITDEVQVSNPPRFGANFSGSISPKAWFNACMLNAWNERRTMEPYSIKDVFLVQEHDDFGKGNDRKGLNKYFLRPQKGEKKGQPFRKGISNFQKYDPAVWIGAEAHLLRLVNGKHESFHTTRISDITVEDLKDRPKMRGKKLVNYDRIERFEFETAIPNNENPLQPGDVMIIQDTLYDVRKRFQDPNPRYTGSAHGFFKAYNGAVDCIDPAYKCPEGGSTASMKITLPGNEEGAGMAQAFLHKTPVPRGWLELTKGKEFSCQVWVRQEGMSSGSVTIDVAGIVSQTVVATGEWQKVTLTIPADSQNTITQKIANLSISSTEAGTLWIDNFLVWQTDTPPFAFNKQYTAALKAYKPGHLRYWGSYKSPTQNMLQHGWSMPDQWSIGRRIDGTNHFSFHSFLSICQEVGSEPWIILRSEQTDKDIHDFMEYLGGSTDTPMGALRASHGQEKPWTSIFTDIIIGSHNEAWGTGYGPYHEEIDIYIGMTNRLFHLIKQTPYYNADQFVFAANGKTGSEAWQRHYKTKEYLKDKPGWSMQVALGATESDAIDAAYYIGGADGLTVLGKDDTDFYGKQLMYAPRIVEPRFDRFAILHEEVAQKIPGKEYRVAMYEGGPGYPTPNGRRPFTPVGEQVGKSLALGVTTLDAYMIAQAGGFHSQCYFGFAMGNNFSSHHSHNQLYAWPSWLSLQLRNAYCGGDLMRVEETELTRVDFPSETVIKESYDGKRKVKRTIDAKPNIAFTRCYAYKNGQQHSFIIFNRHYNKAMDVQLNLPFTPKPEINIHYLTSDDPRTSNRDAKNIVLQHEQRNDFTNKYHFTAQASSAYVIVCEEQ